MITEFTPDHKRPIAIAVILMVIIVIFATIVTNNQSAKREEFKSGYVTRCSSATLNDLSLQQTKTYCACAYDAIEKNAGGVDNFDKYMDEAAPLTISRVSERCLP